MIHFAPCLKCGGPRGPIYGKYSDGSAWVAPGCSQCEEPRSEPVMSGPKCTECMDCGIDGNGEACGCPAGGAWAKSRGQQCRPNGDDMRE